jgi:secreted PhoX family phosphatase
MDEKDEELTKGATEMGEKDDKDKKGMSRRSFFKGAGLMVGAAALGAALSPVASEATPRKEGFQDDLQNEFALRSPL